jgi:uncharacterized membrane protein
MLTFFASRTSLVLSAIFYFLAGLYHFINPDFYVKMMPSWFVEKHLLNALAGIAEIVCAFALLVPKLRNWGVYGIIILLISFFSVHINHFFEPPTLEVGGLKINFSEKPTYYGLFLRFMLHFFLLWWIWQLRRQTKF